MHARIRQKQNDFFPSVFGWENTFWKWFWFKCTFFSIFIRLYVEPQPNRMRPFLASDQDLFNSDKHSLFCFFNFEDVDFFTYCQIPRNGYTNKWAPAKHHHQNKRIYVPVVHFFFRCNFIFGNALNSLDFLLLLLFELRSMELGQR